MLDTIISGSNITSEGFIVCLMTSLALGAVIAAFHSFRNRYSKNFLITLVLLPAIIQSVIMLVNGNVGTGVAVMGAFSLVRFRSLPGNSREISSIFFAMAVGLATGKVVIPENLDYAGIFDDVFAAYAEGAQLIKVKTVNMGSLYELIYHLTLKSGKVEKKMIDDLRARNGNLEIVCGRIAEKVESL